MIDKNDVKMPVQKENMKNLLYIVLCEFLEILPLLYLHDI